MSLDFKTFSDRLAELRAVGSVSEISSVNKVRRWIVRGGIFVVTETSQPNLWMSRKVFEMVPSLKKLKIDNVIKDAAARTIVRGKINPGRHSNVHSSKGFGDIDLVRLRFESLTQLNNFFDTVLASKWKPL